MPLITVTAHAPKSDTFKASVFDSVHSALVSVGVPKDDLFQRFHALDAQDFRVDRAYPDVQGQRSDNFVLIEILWSVGRSVKVKRQFLTTLMKELSQQGFNPEDVMVVFQETRWENWSFAGGRQIHT